MSSSSRSEALLLLAELSDAFPDVRLGQLICNLAVVARGANPESIWEIEDSELVDAARYQLEQVQTEITQ